LSASSVDVEEADFNPIHKVPVIVCGNQGTVLIEVIDSELRTPANVMGRGAMQLLTAIQGQLLAIQSSLNQLRRKINDVKTNQAIDWNWLEHSMQMLSELAGNQGEWWCCLATRTRDDKNDTTIPVRAPPIASLLPAPKVLYQLWNECEHSIGGRKPAKHLSLHERRKVKHIYSLCNAGRQIIPGLVWLGHTSKVAIGRIYAVYAAQTSVTAILRSLKKDVKAGRLSPNLQA
jgi:hypothetical protein